MSTIETPIDFVITWVDGHDPEWLKERNYYASIEHVEVDNGIARFRDWENLQYWFRGIEKFAPWVNKIYFVTYGHVPEWLDTKHQKIRIVKHSDFIPAEYLPTFNSNVIEFFFHRIQGLSEHFVYFNDDFFLIDYVSPSRFFRDGLPCDMAALSADSFNRPSIFDSSVYLSTALINKHFSKSEVMRRNLTKWFSSHYIKTSLRNASLAFLPLFPGFNVNHVPLSFLRSTYLDVWGHCGSELERTSRCKFRQYGIVAFWLFRYWQLATGNFYPYNTDSDGEFLEIQDYNIDWIAGRIEQQKKSIVCLNDTENISDFQLCKTKIIEAFDKILPERCSFELS